MINSKQELESYILSDNTFHERSDIKNKKNIIMK